MYKEKPKFLDQMNHCEKNAIPFAVILGEEELKGGVVKIKDVRNREDKGIDVQRENIIGELKSRIQTDHAPSSSSASTADISLKRFHSFCQIISLAIPPFIALFV